MRPKPTLFHRYLLPAIQMLKLHLFSEMLATIHFWYLPPLLPVRRQAHLVLLESLEAPPSLLPHLSFCQQEPIQLSQGLLLRLQRPPRLSIPQAKGPLVKKEILVS